MNKYFTKEQIQNEKYMGKKGSALVLRNKNNSNFKV